MKIQVKIYNKEKNKEKIILKDILLPLGVAVLGGLIIYSFTLYKEKKVLTSLKEDADNYIENNDCEQAVLIYENILKKISKKDYGEMYSNIKFKQGICFNKLSFYKEKEVNLKKSIYAYNEALTYIKFSKNKDQIALIKFNLADSYAFLSEVRDIKRNLSLAEKEIEEVLDIWTKDYNNMAYAKSKIVQGSIFTRQFDINQRGDELIRAIDAFTNALSVFTKKNNPVDFANANINLGIAYSNLSEIDNNENTMDAAVNAFKKALDIFTVESFPMDYACIHLNLGNVYKNYFGLENKNNVFKEEMLLKAILSLNEAMLIYTKELYTRDYALIHLNIGIAYLGLSNIKDTKNNLNKALESTNEALLFLNKRAYPIDFAKANLNLGSIKMSLANIENDENQLINAIDSIKSSLSIFKLEKYPKDYAKAKFLLGKVYKRLFNYKNEIEYLHTAKTAFVEARNVYNEKSCDRCLKDIENELKDINEFYK